MDKIKEEMIGYSILVKNNENWETFEYEECWEDFNEAQSVVDELSFAKGKKAVVVELWRYFTFSKQKQK